MYVSHIYTVDFNKCPRQRQWYNARLVQARVALHLDIVKFFKNEAKYFSAPMW